MTEAWVIDDGRRTPASSGVVLEILQARISNGQLETWLTSSSDRSLAFVTNTRRAMVVLFDGECAEQHAVDPGSGGSSDGFVLSNGQDDEYADEDTVPLEEAFRIVGHILSEGGRPPDARWANDR
ncbi:hypothetical protein [Streptomyces sp. NPDC096339]|uniref:hypothetical protein n=1 Tax=Streptomyces sp. NPDC096339 TaxID=3366086 RepID=UPI00380FB07E